ncbi:MAG: transcriptional regulator [Clostridiaceae bacterium]|nr:transcriptional regulator [Clostridiaceae bacterium]
MDTQRLKQLLSREEGEKLDFKAELNLNTESEKKELAKDVTAIANSRGGRGYIIYGVEDKTKRILGINTEDFQEEQIQQIIYNRTDPPVPVNVDFVQIKDKTVAVLTIFRSRHAPHQVLQTGAFYVRRGSTTDFARRSELASIMQENGLMSFETVMIKNSSVDDLDFDIINRYFSRINISMNQPKTIILDAFGFISQRYDGNYSPTIGGLLLFGKAPQIYLPHCYVRIICNNDVEILSGNILSMMDQVIGRIKSIINREDYPFEAFEEALANALVHRDYLDLSRGITINITEKTVEIINPGAISQRSNVNLHMNKCAPERRNPWLYQRLITIDERRRFVKSDMGMIRIRKAFEKIGKVKFINLIKQNSFKVILPR